MNGIVIVDKPQGMTSHTVVNRLRRIYNCRQVGHGGTLDPMATGVLPAFIGRATKAAGYVRDGDKTYIARFRFGITTDTEDITGEILTQTPCTVSAEALEDAVRAFRGNILQIPPMYSAVQVGGQRLYRLARSGIEIEREARPVTVHEFERIAPPSALPAPAPEEFDFRITCSKGTFIRTLCADVGKALGCGAALSALRRVHTGIFDIAEAYTLDELERRAAEGTLEATLSCSDILFSELPGVTLWGDAEARIRRGAPVYLANQSAGRKRIYSKGGEFLGIGLVRETDRRPELSIEKGFFDPQQPAKEGAHES